METIAIKEMEGLTFKGIITSDKGESIWGTNDVMCLFEDYKNAVWVIRPAGDFNRGREHHFPISMSLEHLLKEISFGTGENFKLIHTTYKYALTLAESKLKRTCDENNILKWNLESDDGLDFLEFDMTSWFEKVDKVIEKL